MATAVFGFGVPGSAEGVRKRFLVKQNSVELNYKKEYDKTYHEMPLKCRTQKFAEENKGNTQDEWI